MSEALWAQVAVPLPLDRLFSYRIDPRQSAPIGARVVVPFGARSLTGVVVGHDDPDRELKDPKTIERVLDPEPLVDAHYIEFARWLSAMYLCSLGEALEAMLPGARVPRELVVESGEEPAVSTRDLQLSVEQRAALDSITGAEGTDRFYLYGITGSGKTEVFLQAAERTLSVGSGVIYLVPEIALTHQLFEHIGRRFGGAAAMLHSGLTPARRLSEWHRIRRGEARLVVGARSAVFAPLERVGLVIIDEEHESSYKSGSTPRYHARQVAMWRARRDGGRCVMGSATPSVEAWHLMNEGVLRRLDLTRRLSGGALPRIGIVDLRRSATLLSKPLREALERTRAEGLQSILFLNRRGFAHVFQCRSCGYHMQCPRCSVPLTYHKSNGRMVCHYCGYHTRPVQVCPSCNSLDVSYTGFGTQRIEEELTATLPDLRVARLDTDAAQKRGAAVRILKAFAAGEYDVLLGTQMVAKGLNFPRVKTVGIVMADTGLNLPDFRAAERTFALIVQVAGRAGRFRADGEVLVQTVVPDAAAVVLAVRNEPARFYAEELRVRRELGFPPFSRLVRLVVRGTRVEAVRAIAEKLAAALEPLGVDVLGPAACPLERLNRSWRYHVIVRGTAIRPLQGAVARAREVVKVPPGVYVEIDVDPTALL